MIDIHKVTTNTNDAIEAVINKKILENPMLIECKTDREKMLCEQVLRVVRGEPSQELINTYWKDVQPDHIINIDKLIRYRAKPKKELAVPWEWLREEIDEVVVTKEGFIKGYANGSEYYQLFGLSLDLEGVDLPVTVKRP